MEVRVAPNQANQLDQKQVDEIRKIIQDNFKGKGIDQEIQAIDIVPDSSQSNLTSGSADCGACDVAFAAAVAACNALPFPPAVPICIAAATVAYNGCRDRNCK